MLESFFSVVNSCEIGEAGFWMCFWVSYDFIALVIEVALIIMFVPLTINFLEFLLRRTLHRKICGEINEVGESSQLLLKQLKFQRSVEGKFYSLADDEGTVTKNNHVHQIRRYGKRTTSLINTFSHNIVLNHLEFIQCFMDYFEQISITCDEIEKYNWEKLSLFERN